MKYIKMHTAIAFLLALSIVSCAPKEDSSKSFTLEYNTIFITKDIPYREDGSDAWKLDLAMTANSGSEIRPALIIECPELTQDFVAKMKANGANIEYLEGEGKHGVAYTEKFEVTDPAIEKIPGQIPSS